MRAGIFVEQPPIAGAVAVAFETITVSSSVISLTAAQVDPTDRKSPRMARLSVEGDSIRYRVDGSDPTTTIGHKLVVGDFMDIVGWENLKKLRMVDVSTDATVQVTYYI